MLNYYQSNNYIISLCIIFFNTIKEYLQSVAGDNQWVRVYAIKYSGIKFVLWVCFRDVRKDIYDHNLKQGLWWTGGFPWWCNNHHCYPLQTHSSLQNYCLVRRFLPPLSKKIYYSLTCTFCDEYLLYIFRRIVVCFTWLFAATNQ